MTVCVDKYWLRAFKTGTTCISDLRQRFASAKPKRVVWPHKRTDAAQLLAVTGVTAREGGTNSLQVRMLLYILGPVGQRSSNE